MRVKTKWLMSLALLAISKVVFAVDAQKMSLPGEITLNENKVTHVVSVVQGHVKDIYKNLGEPVEKGERLVSFQSREMAEIKAAYLAAYQEIQLKNEILKREEKLCKAHVKAEIEFAKTKIGVETAKIHLEQAKQKLLALGVSIDEINHLPEEKEPLNLCHIHSPLDGVIIERHLTRGGAIDKDKQIYVIGDLDTVWVNLAIDGKDMRKIHKGQKAVIYSHDNSTIAHAEIMYISPVNDKNRNGRAIVELDNAKHQWHPGDEVKVELIVSDKMPHKTALNKQ